MRYVKHTRLRYQKKKKKKNHTTTSIQVIQHNTNQANKQTKKGGNLRLVVVVATHEKVGVCEVVHHRVVWLAAPVAVAAGPFKVGAPKLTRPHQHAAQEHALRTQLIRLANIQKHGTVYGSMIV